MASAPLPLHPTTASSIERLFPTLTDAQIARIAAHGRRRAITPGEVLVDIGDKVVPFFVVVSGAIEASRPAAGVDTLIVTPRAGQFSGVAAMITGRRAIGKLRVSEPGEVVQLDR